MYFERNEMAIKETKIKYGRLCFNVAYNILHNNEDAEECVNDTYLCVWNKIPPTKPDNFKAFICKITRNLSLTRLKYNIAKKRSPDSLISFSNMNEIISNDSISSDAENEEIGRILSDFLRTEKADARNIFVRRYWFLDSIKDIADRYSFSESKVKSILFHVRNRLKKYLKKEGIDI